MDLQVRSGKWEIRSFLSTKFQVPNTKFQAPSTKFQIPNSKYQIPNSNTSTALGMYKNLNLPAVWQVSHLTSHISHLTSHVSHLKSQVNKTASGDLLC